MKQPIAIITVSNNISVHILAMEHGIEDKVKFNWNGGRTCTAKMRYEADGRAYFKSGKFKLYFDEAVFISTN